MTFRSFAAGAACAVLLAACGGDAADAPKLPNAASAEPVRTLSGVPVTQFDHEASVQRLYLAYFGRAADPGGLAYYTELSWRFGLAADTGALYWRHGVDADVRAILDGMATSPEADAFYGPDSRTTLTLMYRNLFNREPDEGGLAYWADLLERGVLTRGQVPLALLAGADIADLTIFDRKAAVATAFTAALDTPERAARYNGAAAVDALRAVLAKIDANTSPAHERALVEEALAAIGAAG